jgi:hypothetical protein
VWAPVDAAGNAEEGERQFSQRGGIREGDNARILFVYGADTIFLDSAGLTHYKQRGFSVKRNLAQKRLWEASQRAGWRRVAAGPGPRKAEKAGARGRELMFTLAGRNKR